VIRSIVQTAGGIATLVIQTPRRKIQGFTLGYSGVLIVASRTMSGGDAMMIYFLRFVEWLADALKALALRLNGYVDKELKRKFEAKE